MNCMMNRLTSIALVVSIVAPCMVLSCAQTTPTLDGAQSSAVLVDSALVGTWISELDGSTLTIEPTGIFEFNTAALNARPAGHTVGRWTSDGAESTPRLTMMELAGSGACAELPGIYKAEVVRDTVRFELVSDECAARSTPMAWPWKRSAKAASNTAKRKPRALAQQPSTGS